MTSLSVNPAEPIVRLPLELPPDELDELLLPALFEVLLSLDAQPAEAASTAPTARTERMRMRMTHRLLCPVPTGGTRVWRAGARGLTSTANLAPAQGANGNRVCVGGRHPTVTSAV